MVISYVSVLPEVINESHSSVMFTYYSKMQMDDDNNELPKEFQELLQLKTGTKNKIRLRKPNTFHYISQKCKACYNAYYMNVQMCTWKGTMANEQLNYTLSFAITETNIKYSCKYHVHKYWIFLPFNMGKKFIKKLTYFQPSKMTN